MKVRYIVPLVALDALLVCSFLITPARSSDTRPEDGHHLSAREKPTGIITDRIPARLLQKWQAILRLMLAENGTGEALHPRLRSLYQWADSSSHAIYIEMIVRPQVSGCAAGNFSVRHFDPTGQRHEGLISLYLSNIDRAYVSGDAARPDGLIPFRGLKKIDRYAEVLGHELQHAFDILSDRERTREVRTMVDETNEMLLSHIARRRGGSLSAELHNRLRTRDRLLRELEGSAGETERIIWEELIASRPARLKKTGKTHRHSSAGPRPH